MKFTQLYTLLLTLVLVFPIVKLSVDAISMLNNDDQYELTENSDEERSDKSNNEEEGENEVEEYIIDYFASISKVELESKIAYILKQRTYNVCRELLTPPPRFV